MRIYIIEDEIISAEYVKLIVQELGHIVVGSGFKMLDVLEDIERFKPDIVLLDIELGKHSGFDILEKLEYKPFVIVTTAYQNYAVDAFEKNTELKILDFVLKPISKERLKKALEKCSSYSAKKIKINVSKEIIEFGLEEIIYVEAFGKNSLVATLNDKIDINKSFKEVSNLFEKQGFKKVHRSYIINPNKVKKLERTNFSWTLLMTNGDKVPVSREHLKELKAQLFFQE